MRMSAIGAAFLAAAALASCSKNDAETAADNAAENAPIADTSIDLSGEAAEAVDVYAAQFEFDLSTIRTKEALNAAADAAFTQADADGDGALTLHEFYALAALLAPAAPVEGAVDTITDVFAESGAGAIEAAEETFPEEPVADASALDDGFAIIAGDDGILTMGDLQAAFAAKFDSADANSDGTLDDAESASLVSAQLF
jgi:hypothetical protein